VSTAALLLPLLASLLLSVSGRRLAALLPPAVAVVGLAVAGPVAAISTGFALSVLGFQLFAQLRPIAEVGHWSAAALGSSDPLPDVLGAAAGLVAVALISTAALQIWRTGRAIAAASSVCRQLGPDAGGLVVIQDSHADAYTVPGLPTGRIVVSTSMLQALDPSERRALLAHETAHLSRRHHVFVQLVDIAAAADPLLRPLRRAVRLGVERWADEFAARRIGDRRVVACALARAGLARASTGASRAVPGALAGADTDLCRRVHALLSTPPRRRPVATILLAGLVVALMLASVSTADHLDARFDRASAIYSLHVRAH
jgi:Zn-dependent protease with chaperone function